MHAEIEFIIEDGEEEDNDLSMYSYINNHLCFEYFVGYEITTLLGYKNPGKTINDNVSKSNKLIFRDYQGVKEPYLDPRTILITRDGVNEILIKTRKRISPDVLHILKKFNINIANCKCLTKEQQTLSSIRNVFNTEKFEDQYKIGAYYLDLYFSEYKIVIECDENGHADRKPWKERERMNYVNKKLGIDDSYWIRFNPNEEDFDISRVIGRIYRKIDEIKIKYLKEEVKSHEKIEKEEDNDLSTYSYINNDLCFEYFVGYEITTLLGYKNPTEIIKNNVSKSNQLVFKDYPGVKELNLNPRTILITREGANEILIKTRKRVSPDVLHILKKFNIDTTNRKCLTKEQQTLSAITNVFKTEKFEDQYKIGTYYLDLYFSEYKIVIECDENGHADRKPWKERERMNYVNEKLGIDDSYWIRFNPDEEDFDISRVIGRIYRKIDEIKTKYLKEDMKSHEKIEEMINEKIEKEEDNDLSTYSYINNDLCFEYFVGYEITTLLGYKNPTEIIKNNVSKSNQLVFKDYPGVKELNLNPRTILITREGANEILIKTRKRVSPDVLHILKKFNIDTTNRKCLTKEQQTLSAITNVFKTEKFEDQYKIGTYYLDLYFSEYKIVIECDENGHADRKPWKERERMNYVNEKLGIDDSYWIRFNPDEEDFDISRVIGRIYRKIDEIKTEYVKVLEEEKFKEKIKEMKKKEFRKCKKCNIKKKLTEEFFSPCGTGLSNACKECCYFTGAGNEKPVKQYDMEGKFIRRFNSLKEAEELTNCRAENIGRNCRGVVKSSGNYVWRFVEAPLEKEKEIVKEDIVNEYVVEEEEKEEIIEIKNNLVIKTVAQYNMDGTFVKTYKSGNEAARHMNVTPPSIYGAIRNNFVCKGYLWRYVNNEEIVQKIEEVTLHKKYMKKVEIYKDGKLYKSFLSIKAASVDMKVNISMVRKFLEGKKDPKNFEWRFG